MTGLGDPVGTAFDTALRRSLDIHVPILQAGMGLGARAELVAAVSGAGGLGVLGGAPLRPDELRAQIHQVRAATDRSFGVDLLLPPQLTTDDATVAAVRDAVADLPQEQRDALPELEAIVRPGHVDDQIQVCIDERVPVLVAGLGSPAPYLDGLHAAGVQVFAIAGSVGHAVRHAADGVDAVIASGSDGGGHVGRVGSLSLWCGCVDAVDVPVIGGGGVADGRTFVAALSAGCQGVWVGTRFLATVEADAHDAAKQRLVETTTDGTTVTRAISGKPMRVIRNAYVDGWRGRDHEVLPFPMQALANEGRGAWALRRGDVVEGVIPAGSSTGLVHDVPTAAEVVQRLVAEAQATLATLAGIAPVDVAGSR